MDRIIVIDGERIGTAEDFHNLIEESAAVDGYGKNLDALYDEASTMRGTIVLERVSSFRKNLGAYADRIIDTLRDAQEDNDFLTVILK